MKKFYKLSFTLPIKQLAEMTGDEKKDRELKNKCLETMRSVFKNISEMSDENLLILCDEEDYEERI